MIRPATLEDAPAIADIYNHHVHHAIATFEEEPVTAQEMARRMGEVLDVPLPWLVAVEDGRVLGYAYASKWKPRTAYRFTVEASVYLADGSGGRGWGTQLHQELRTQLKQAGYHALIAGVALPNPASVALLEKFGMAQVAHFKETGFKFGQWIDVGYWEGLL